MKTKTTPVTAKQKMYGDFLKNLQWSYYCTFTTSYKLSTTGARNHMANYQSYLNKRMGKCSIFWVAEPFDCKEGNHLHALVNLKSEHNTKLQKQELQTIWQIVTGTRSKKRHRTLIKMYNSKLGAAYYVCKYLDRRNADYDLLT